MKINRLEVKRYKNLRAFDETFETGINLISGPNEAGKSTLVEAITDLFFEDPSSTRKELKEKIGWDCDQAFELAMEFEIDGTLYRLSKDFEEGNALLTKVAEGEEITDKKKILGIIESGLGLANRDIFLATSTIKQDEIGRVSKSSEAIKDKLEGLITGGREEVLASEAISKIEDNIRNIKKEGSKHFGVLQKLDKTKSELVYELDKAKREIDQIGKNRVKLKETQSLLEGIKTEYAAKKSHMEKAAKAARNEQRLEELENRFQDLNNRVTSVRSSEEIVKKLKEEIAELPEIDSTDLSLAQEQSAQIRYLQGKYDTVEEKTDELAEQISLASPGVFIKAATLFMLLLTLGAAAYWYFMLEMADNRFIFGALGGFVLFIVLSSIWGSKAKHTGALKLKYNLKYSNLEDLESDLENARVSVETVLEKYKCKEINELKDKYDNHRDLDREIKTEVRRYEGWLNGKGIKELEKELQEVTKDLAVETETNRDLKMYSMNAEEKEKLNVLVEALEKQKSVLEGQEVALTRQLEFAESGCELQASLEERLEEIDNQIETAKYQLKLYETAKKYIEVSRKNVLKASLGVLEQETSEVLSQVTSGRYSRVRFDRQSLKFELFSAEKDDWVDPDKALSRGARDQLYLAARMALVRIISQERNPVLIFDEPFLTFDARRRDNAIGILKQYAQDYQIIVLSCNNYYDSSAAKNIFLGDVQASYPTAVPQSLE